MTRPDPFPPVSRARPVDRVTDRLRTAVLTGDPAPGELLPPERELAVRLGVSRLTLRAAVARLEAEGLLRARQGEGVRVLDPARHGTLDLLRHVPLHARPDVVAAVLELRRALAAEAVALAAARIGAPAREHLRALAAAQGAERDAAAWLERDLAFTRGLLEGAGNLALVLLLNGLEGVWRANPALSAALAADREAALAGYALVLSLLDAPRADARDLVRLALEAADAAALARLRGGP